MNYIPSVNIEMNTVEDFQYIFTGNAKLVAGSIANGFNSGHHSFSIIGTYGTGKSSFILALEHDLIQRAGRLLNADVFGQISGFDFLNIVGDYEPLSSLLATRLGVEPEYSLDALKERYDELRKKKKFLVIVIDEFGKVLEHASATNPEKELYFLQKLAEFVNVPSRRIILVTTLHQNFGSYAARLSETQRNEWLKVKGRFQEIVFAEPVEQLLALTAERMKDQLRISEENPESLRYLTDMARNRKIVSPDFSFSIARALYPLDPVSAVCLTMAIQRYGQNERSLFSFLASTSDGSILSFKPKHGETYNLAALYDYLTYNFYSSISETNSDSMIWRALSVAIERVEGLDVEDVTIRDCLKLIKSIGLLNMFFKGVRVDEEFLIGYGKHALGLTEVERLLEILVSAQIIRYASYKSQYILFEGTNVDIEAELYKAASQIPRPSLTADEILPFIEQKVAIASASFYKTGTPRYFEYRVSNQPEILEPTGDIDGYVHLILPLSDIEKEVVELSASPRSGASVYCYFRNTDKLAGHLYQIAKLKYVIEHVAFDDRVAKAELENQKAFETAKLNDAVNSALTSLTDDVVWYFRGERILVNSLRDLNKLLSHVCNRVYYATPIIKNELFNRQKLSSAISLARVNLLEAMLTHSDKPAFGIESFPPEKTIYYTLFKTSGIHRQDETGNWILGAPTSEDFKSLWEVSMRFLESTVEKPGKLSDLVKILKSAPYKLKQGVIDFWIPIFLFINQQEFALYNGSTFVLNINKEVFELIQKRMSVFSVRAFKVTGIRLEFFKRYRQFLKKDDGVDVSSASLIETIRPFFRFYRGLNQYARTTRKFDNVYTERFRDVLSKAEDPAKTFFEELPAALGYKDLNGDDFVERYLDLIRNAVRELNRCYDNLIDRIEERILAHLGLPAEYSRYKSVLEQRYATIDSRILSPKTRAFLSRLIAPSESKRELIEKLAIVVNDKRLEELRDNEEPMLVRQMLYLLSELERQSAMASSGEDEEGSEAYSFELASNRGGYSRTKTYRLPKSKSAQAAEVSAKIDKLLTEDEDLNICILLKLLNDKLK